MSLRATLGYLILALAAIASYFAAGGPDTRAPETIETTFDHDGYYMLDAVIRGFGTDGRSLYALKAAEIAEDQEAELVRLTGVELIYRDDVDVPWRLNANAGELAIDGSRLTLTGDVAARNESGNVATTLTTSTLTVDPERYEIRTDARVTLKVGERSISATGMLAFLNEDRIEFRSNVSGKFLP